MSRSGATGKDRRNLPCKNGRGKKQLTAYELNEVKEFFNLPDAATPSQVKAVLAACAHAGGRRARSGKAAPQSSSKKAPKSTIASFFQQKPTGTNGTVLSVGDVLSHGAKESEGFQLFLGKRSTRTSKIKSDGAGCWGKLLAAHRDRNKGSAMAADACLDAMVSECKKDRQQTKKGDDQLRRNRTVAGMEALLMTGDILWAQSVLVRFNSRPVAVELRNSCPSLFSSERLQTKEEQVGAMFVNQLRDFVAILTATKVGIVIRLALLLLPISPPAPVS
jgi:hypothetical protein